MEAATLSSEDRNRLTGFLSLVKELVDAVLERERFFSLEMHGLLVRAWDELLAEGRFEMAEEAILSGRYDQALREHGLAEAQLEVKVVGAERADAKAKRLFRKFLRLPWHQALETANVALGSIALAVPIVGAIQEAKDITEAAIKERVTIGERIIRTRDAVRGRLPWGKREEQAVAGAGEDS